MTGRKKYGIRVLVASAISNTSLAVIRSLARHNCEIIGADHRRLPFGLHSRYTKPYSLYPADDAPDFTAGVINLLDVTRPDVFISSNSSLAMMVARHYREISRLTRALVPDIEDISVAYDNEQTLRTCHALGIDCPVLLDEPGAVERLEAHANDGNIVVVKPKRDVGGGCGVSYVRTKRQLQDAIATCQRHYGEASLQEYIPGPVTAMRTVMLLFNKDSRLRGFFTMQKIRQYPLTGGTTAIGVSTREEDLLEMVLPFFEKCHWRGPAEVELKIDARDGRPKVIEINPRFGGYVGFPVACGLNFPWITCMAALGRDEALPALPDYAIGRKYIIPDKYFRSLIAELRCSNNKLQSLNGAFRDLRGLTPDLRPCFDPMPRTGKALRGLGEFMARRPGCTAG